MGGMFFGGSMPVNPLQPQEKRVLVMPVKYADRDGDDDDEHSYTIKVGDVCFVAIGQIVGDAEMAASPF